MRVYLLAYPAKHSLSPVMHNAAFAHAKAQGALDVLGHYEALEVHPDQLAQAVARLREPDCYGANVTVPHKLAVMAYLDDLSDSARAIGAVNTIVNQNGRLIGHNTDGAGFAQALNQDSIDPHQQHIVMLGAGGAAQAVLHTLLRTEPARLGIYNRTQAKADALVHQVAQTHPCTYAITSDTLAEAVAAASLVINTTSVGMEYEGVDPQISPLPKGVLPEQGAVVDIVYKPAQTQLLKEAHAAALQTQNGLPMLIYQGAEAFRIWTEVTHVAPVMFAAARQAIYRDFSA